ncbi:MAG: MaoC family dehydratase [Dehalococcoidia bacterium]
MPEPGQTATRQLTVTSEIVEKYAEITGDYNPLHFDERFVAGTQFGKLIAQGGIATGLLHALVAMDIPGAGSVFLRQQWSFPKPVYIGDTITARGTVKSWRTGRAMGDMEFVVENQVGEVVLRGEATVFQATSPRP